MGIKMQKNSLFSTRVWLVFMLLLGLVGCSNIQVSQDYQENTNFSNYQTYYWLPADKQTKPKAVTFEKENPLLAQRIKNAIEQALQTKGYRLVDTPDAADAYITYHYSTSQKIRSDQVTTGIGFGTGWYGGFGGIGFQTAPDVEQYEEGQLLIDVLTKDDKLLWRGKSTAPLNEHPKPEETTKRVQEIVQKMMAQYPPDQKPDNEK